jgi:hypothetical protein
VYNDSLQPVLLQVPAGTTRILCALVVMLFACLELSTAQSHQSC